MPPLPLAPRKSARRGSRTARAAPQLSAPGTPPAGAAVGGPGTDGLRAASDALADAPDDAPNVKSTDQRSNRGLVFVKRQDVLVAVSVAPGATTLRPLS